LGLQITGTHRD